MVGEAVAERRRDTVANARCQKEIGRMRFQRIPHQLDESLPLIYMWEIRDCRDQLVGMYVGKAKAGASRPLQHYVRNVNNILRGRPCPKNTHQGYRRIHRALACAHRAGHQVSLHLLCNVHPGEDIDEVEQRYIRLKKSAGDEAWQLNA
jgi:hypothetical protein